MKIKNVLMISFLAIAGIFGASSAIVNNQVKETPVVEKAEAAGTAKFYLIRNWDWGVPRIHYWGGDSSSTWDNEPAMNDEGVNATRGGATGRVYSYTIPTNTTGIIIRSNNRTQRTQVDYTSWNPSGNNAAYFTWSDNKNQLVGANYKNTNPSSTKNTFYVYDPHTVLGSTLANINVYGYGETDVYKGMDWPGTHTGVTSTTLGITPMYQVSLSVSYPNAIVNCGNGNNQTENLTSISSHAGQVLVIKSGHSSKTYETEWVDASKFNGSGNYPAAQGYYVVNSTNSYTFTGSSVMSTSSLPDGYVAKLINYSATKDVGIKIRGFYNDREDPNIWSFYNGNTEEFGAADGDGNFVFTKTLNVDIYGKYINDELKFYVLEHVDNPGYYILGNAAFATDHGSSATPWTFASGLKMNTLSGEGNRASYVLTVNTTVVIRLRECLSVDHGWLTFPNHYDGTDGITTQGDNVQILAGTYTLYVNSEGAAYILKGIPLDAFCTDFLSAIDEICEWDGSTPTSTLFSRWSELSDLYDEVLSSEKPTIVNIGFNGGNDTDDPHRVVLAYHYIVTKYGTANCNDFIWNQNINPRSAISSFNPFTLMNGTDGGDNATTIIIIIAASVSLLSITALSILLVKKRKRVDN